MNNPLSEFVNVVILEMSAGCRICKGETSSGDELCDEHKKEPSKLELLPATISPVKNHGSDRTVRTHYASVDGKPRQKDWRG